jgi:hypothetical protein
MKDIESMIRSMSAEDILSLMANINSNSRRTVDTSHRQRRIAMTELYFSVAPLPYKTNYEEYKLEAEAIRQQVMSGVDL